MLDSSAIYNFVLKTETDTTTPNVCTVLVLYDIDRHVMHTFSDEPDANPIAMGAEVASMADTIVVHSGFAIKVVAKLYGFIIDPANVVDTLELARRLAGPRNNKLDDWAKRLQMPRSQFRGSDHWTQEVQHHCEQDALIIDALLAHLSKIGV
jgi:hypothetical protein